MVSIMSQESNFDGKKIIIYVQCTGVWIESQDYGSKMNDFNHRLYESQLSGHGFLPSFNTKMWIMNPADRV